MYKKAPNLVGQKFGKYTVLNREKNTKYNESRWKCRCECGTEKIVYSHDLLRKTIISCGCYRKEIHKKHGACFNNKPTPEYKSYHAAKTRCNNKNNPFYNNYGGRGIKFLLPPFIEFLAKLGPRPTLQHSLDRIDNNGHYELGNVRWATKKEQTANRRRCTSLFNFSDSEILAEISRRFPNHKWSVG